MGTGKIKHFFEQITDWIYPPICPLCESLLARNETYICKNCEQKQSFVQTPACLKCGKEIDDEERELCEDCKNHTKSFVRGYPAMNYEEPVKGSLYAFKYQNRRSYAKYFAYEIAKSRGRDILAASPEALVPIPVHAKKLRKRGYNQAELIANALGEILQIPVDTTLLERSSNTLPQKKLDPKEREQNLKKAFNSTEKIVKYKSVMLVDDIYTSGATMEACTKILKENGIRDIYFTCVCIGRGY